MNITFRQWRSTRLFRLTAALMVVALAGTMRGVPSARAQTLAELPRPGTRVAVSGSFTPPILSGLTIYPDNPLQFDFIIDTGDDALQGEALHAESMRLIKYFMTTLTVPETELWVNLSPYEKNRIVADGLGNTQMGVDMLAQDYLLKQLTASLMYPEEELGQAFWERVYRKAHERFGTTDIPVNTYKKIWIVPADAAVYEEGNSVFIAGSRLKVLLEEDYLAEEANAGRQDHGVGAVPDAERNAIGAETSQIVKEILIPEIEREVNEGRNFARLRQIYHAMILATWYKNNLRNSVLGQLYVDRNKVDGVDVADKELKQRIYEQYVTAFEQGVYSYIKEEVDLSTDELIPRKYFSGGEDFLGLGRNVRRLESVDQLQREGGRYVVVRGGASPLGIGRGNVDSAILGSQNFDAVTAARAELTVPVTAGEKVFTVTYPAITTRDGEVFSVEEDLITARISEALAELAALPGAFDADLFTSIRVTDSFDARGLSADPSVLDIPLSVLLAAPAKDITVEPGSLTDVAATIRSEYVKVLMLYETGYARGENAERISENVLRYLGGLAPTDREMPFYPDAPVADYQIIMPVYNEGTIIDFILGKVKEAGYLDRLVVVNDASTDDTRERLDRWAAAEGLEVIHMETNQRKEGAIRRAIEIRAERLGRLPDKTILLDSDTFFDFNVDEASFDRRIDQVAAYMDDREVAGISFRIDALLPEKPNVLQKTQYAEYAAIRVWNKLLSKQGQLWVINGPAGMFRSDLLLDTLQNMVPDFETGDLLITVNLMKQGHKVGYYPDLKAQTMVPETAGELFKQRRRWERGTTKVLASDAGFYMEQFRRGRWLALQTVLHGIIYLGTVAGLATLPFAENGTDALMNFLAAFGINYGVWVGVNSLLTLNERNVQREGDRLRLMRWFLWQGLIAPAVTIPARFTGFYDATVRRLISANSRNPLADKSTKSVSPGEATDSAVLAAGETPGGIDLNPQMLRLQSDGSGIRYRMPVYTSNPSTLPITGFTPVIIDIIPIGNLSLILGKTDAVFPGGELTAARDTR
ncbi:MAG: glycosyltransferase family 2 protein [Candidatus Omnitrophica bacterium]|nr:glycosyltransferase family 2 protein [Candidatus Omnitrophota bacterium]MCB9721515.1 glycosyltransferase family 2 protein [Candidatus Omnitrophota bacterium]